MPVSAQHKWHFSCQYWIHNFKSQISCASGYHGSQDCSSLSSLSQNPSVSLPNGVMSHSTLSGPFPWAIELLGGGMRKGQSRTLLKAAEKTAETLSLCMQSDFLNWHLPSNWNLNANIVLLNNLDLSTPASFTRRRDTNCTVLWAYISVDVKLCVV